MNPNHLSADIQKTPRHFLPEDFKVEHWETLQPYFEKLLEANWLQQEELEQWLHQWSELQAVISEDACWRQIRMTCDTENKALEEAFQYFCLEIEPQVRTWSDQLNRKFLKAPWLHELENGTYGTMIKTIRKQTEIYREVNVPILAELSVLAQQYGVITGKMSIEVNGKEYTLQQAARFLMQDQRALREEVYHKIQERRGADAVALDTLFDQLLQKRQQVAQQAGYANYRDYKFDELCRFDYTPADCERFHESVRKHILPLVDALYAYRKKQLGLETLRPWDLEAEREGIKPLEPFQDGHELLEKSIQVFEKLHPYFGACLQKMQALHQLDLESRKGKAPGGYNCPLAETGAPFIFMNAAGMADDVVTMMHEGGHAIHSFLCHALPLSAFKEYPMEMAELASMSMELFSMDYWEIFYPDHESLRRARYEELERVLTIFPWIAIIDKFQHWLYTHPGHTKAEREQAWLAIHKAYSPASLNWDRLETYRARLWQKQLHLFEVPFYYIEYGIAQLGALAMWQSYKQDASQTIQHYIEALRKGSTMGLKDLYKEAGIAFDFSDEPVQRLCRFVQEEMQPLLS